ncbi:MAG TPA: TonB family protein [Thermoanaerobaculia bacterium]|nr:TonB family protein [Thermoanaerobaculia bacterium]
MRNRGLIVIIVLGVIFFTLLALIVLHAGRSKPEETAQSETLTVLPMRVRVRTEPNARAAVVTTATSGEHVTMLEDRGAWVRVQTGDGLAGWAERANLERTLERERRLERYANIRKLPPLKGVANARAPLYAGPGIFYPLVGEIADAAGVTIFTRDHDFYAIDWNGAVAYADVDAIDISVSGTRQLDVQTTSAEPPVSDTTATTETQPPVADTALTEPPPTETTPEPTPEPVETSSRVYAAVPPGGSQPQEVDRVVPRYPALARRASIQGAVVVRGIVRRDGTIDNVEIIKDLPYGLGESAREAVSRWRFRPATYNGEAIDVYYTVTVNFRLQ